jgi:hypothetical protein
MRHKKIPRPVEDVAQHDTPCKELIQDRIKEPHRRTIVQGSLRDAIHIHLTGGSIFLNKEN